MIYFIDFGMPVKKSGIEHAAINRMHLFEKHGVDYRLLNRDWDANLHSETRKMGIDDTHLINMFDYYQGSLIMEDKAISAEEVDLGLDPSLLIYTEGIDNKTYEVTRLDGMLFAKIGYRAEDKTVNFVESYDSFGKLIYIDYYDSRGFKTVRCFNFNQTGISNQQWYTPNGKVVISCALKLDGNKNIQLSGFILTKSDGKVYQFDTIDDMFSDFINQINNQTSPGNIMVIDQPIIADEALLNLDKPAYTIAHLHNSHVLDFRSPMTSELNEFFEYQLSNADKYDGFIAATEHQTRDVQARFPDIKKLYTIPVGIVPDELFQEPQIPMAEREYGNITVLARIAHEKRHADIIRAVAKAHEQVPEITLNMYGYANSNELKNELETLITNLHMEKVIKFHEYTTDNDAVLNKAQVFCVTSLFEGFNLAALESSSHGLVGVTYDIEYGPQEIIQDGFSGYIVREHDIDALAEKFVKLFKDQNLLQQMSTNAYVSAKRYSAESIWKKWEQLLKDGSKEA